MNPPFPPFLDKRRFPLLASMSDEPCGQLMGCDNLVLFGLTDAAKSNFITRRPGVEWHLYGDVRWPAQSSWIEFPLANLDLTESGGVLTLLQEIPDNESEPFGWVAENHPLAQLLPAMRSEKAVGRIAALLRAQERTDKVNPRHGDQTPRYVHGYCIYRETRGVGGASLVATYTDLLNREGVPIQKFRIGDVGAMDIEFCQFSLHALFRLNESRNAGTKFQEWHQMQTFAPTHVAGQTIPPKWAKYHPSRTLRTRPILRGLPVPDLVQGSLLQSDFEAAMNARRGEANAHMLAFERSVRPRETSSAIMNADINASLAAFIHRANGGAIYVLPDQLVEEFDHTDCAEARVSDITLPFGCFFLHFTPPQPIKLSSNANVDGCYITRQGDELLVTLTARLEGVDYANSMSVACMDPMFSLHLPTLDPELTIIDAIELGIKEFLETNAPPTEDASQTIERPDGTVCEILDVRARNRKLRIAEFRSQEPAFRAALNIIVNAACFISFRPDDISNDWDGEPSSEVLAAANGTGDSRRSRDKKAGALQRIEDGDFTRVKICGRTLFADTSHTDGDGDGKSPRAHWRRGHWRRQRHGTGLTLVVLRWIRPTIVKKDNGPLSEARIYDL